MAIAKGNESKEAQEFKRIIGVGPVYIKAVNPDKIEHEKLFNTTLEEAPEYLNKREDENGRIYETARVQVILEPAENSIKEIVPLVSMGLFLENRPRVGASSGKTQVIDKYGRTAWVTPEELAAHAIPMYSNGPADIDKDYRPAYVGEEDLMEFVKTYLCIPSIVTWDNNLRKMVPNVKVKPEECECRFDNLDNVFKGDFSEIKDALGFQPTNKIKCLFGVRKDDNGRLYQSVYTRKFLRNSSNNFNVFEKEIQNMIQNASQNGRVLNTEYEATPVHEYKVEPTVFTPTESTISVDTPFETTGESTSPWD